MTSKEPMDEELARLVYEELIIEFPGYKSVLEPMAKALIRLGVNNGIRFSTDKADSTDELSLEELQEIRVEELKDFSSKILQAELKNQKLQERCDRYEKALEDIRTNTPIQELLSLPYGCACHEIANEALAAIGGDDEN